MRVGFVRTDLSANSPNGRLYLSDVENTSQRNFSSEPKGQSRYFHKPTDAELAVPLNAWAILSIRGTDVVATVDTTVNDTLRIRVGASDAYTVIVISHNVALAKTTIVTEINAALLAAGLSSKLVAAVRGTNQIQINSKAPANSGPSARIQIDSVANGSTLNTAVGFAAGGTTVTGLSVAALKVVTYPTPTTVNVSSAAISALSTFSLLNAAELALLLNGTNVNGVQDVIAPRLVETGPALLSFAFGIISKLRSATFQPGGVRIGLPAGVAAAILFDDGVSIFTL